MLGDTIHAVASPPGASARGVIRVSGPQALASANAVWAGEGGPVRAARQAAEGRVVVLGHPVACRLLVMPGPGSYTGEDVVELHLPGAPLLLARVQAALERAVEGVREALPGEFTRRAYENGRLDLAAAEAVLDLVHAASEDDRRRALAALSGELGAAVDGVRGAVQDALALLESGLDFGDEETGSVGVDEWRPHVERAERRLAALRAELPAARHGGALALRGHANAGKSSLANALAGHEMVLVGEDRGTTRDVIRVPLGGGVEVLDAPGDLEGDLEGHDGSAASPNLPQLDAAALALRDRLLGDASACLLVVDGTEPELPRRPGLPVAAAVVTKADRMSPAARAQVRADLGGRLAVPVLTVSNTTGEGIDALRAFLVPYGATGPSGRGARLAEALDRAGAGLDRARSQAGTQADEIVAMDLREALDALDEIAGRSSPEDLLDRIFGRFCLGK